jgi:hypothetical protein
MIAKILLLITGLVCATDQFTSIYIEYAATYCAPFHHVTCAVGAYNDDGDSVCCTAAGGACQVVKDECPGGSWHVCDVQD